MNVWIQLERLIGELAARIELVIAKLLAENTPILGVFTLYKWNTLMHRVCLSDLDVYDTVNGFRDQIAGSSSFWYEKCSTK